MITTNEGTARAMRAVGEQSAAAAGAIELLLRALTEARHRHYRPAITAERKRFRILARRWRRAEIARKRRPALVHNGRKP